jgi:hypothetical protein
MSAVMFHALNGLALHARPDGTFTVAVAAAPVVRPFTGAGPTDCSSVPGTCTIVVAAAADTKRSAVLPYTLTTH